MTHSIDDVQQQRAVNAADLLDRLSAGLIELNGQALAVDDEDDRGRRVVLEHLARFVEATLPELTDLSMQIRPARIVTPSDQ